MFRDKAEPTQPHSPPGAAAHEPVSGESPPSTAPQPGPDSGLSLSDLMNWATYPETGEPLDFTSEDAVLPRVGGYELLAQIGRGGMGIIYKARQVDSNRIVAVKVMQSHAAHQPDVLRRFRREAQAAARLEHPNVLPIYEVNEEADGTPFFSMKFAAGGSLRERRAAFRGAIRGIVSLMAKVARGTAHAHERGVLHRDLKPDNILFDTGDEPLVSDFGLAGWLHQDDQSTKSVTVCGTPGYLPPEFLEGRPEILLPASDVYSLGVILFELITGRLPFLGSSAMAALREAATRPAPTLRSFVLSIDAGIEMICSRCLEAEPDLRYPSAAALAEDLERWLAGRAIVARPRSRIFHLQRNMRKHKRIILASALCIALLGCGALLYGHQRDAITRSELVAAYNRTTGVLPVEDLDRLDNKTETARLATSLVLSAAASQPEHGALPLPALPEPTPESGDLAVVGKNSGARYLIATTLRRRPSEYRMVLHLIDTATGRKLKVRAFELPTLDSPGVTPLVANLLAGIQNPEEANSPSSESPAPTPGNAHDLELAAEAYTAAASNSPGDPKPAAAAVTAMVARSAFGDADAWLRKALDLATSATRANPSSPELHAAMSRVSMLRSDYPAACEHGLRAFELEPQNVEYAKAVATAFSGMEEKDKASLWNEKARRLQGAARR